jgi:glycogen debranching enzyme
VRVNGASDAARKQASEWLRPLQDHLSDGALGHISEIFDGDAPQRPAGCAAQAWSVGEVLRAYVEDIKGIRPMLPQFATEDGRLARLSPDTSASRSTK